MGTAISTAAAAAAMHGVHWQPNKGRCYRAPMASIKNTRNNHCSATQKVGGHPCPLDGPAASNAKQLSRQQPSSRCPPCPPSHSCFPIV